MDAPIYAPAAAFEPPLATSQPLRIENYSLAELMGMPEAWAIIIKHLPSLQRMVSSPMIKPHLGNFTVQSLQVFVKTATPEVLAAIDAELSKLPSPAGSAP